MSVTLGAAIASSMMLADEAEAATHKVQSGDSLWGISQRYNTSVQILKELNQLNTDLIFPNQVLKVNTSSSSNTHQNSNNSGNSISQDNQNTKADTYTVKRGDTLSGIASKHNISLSNLMKWNNLNTTLIYPGNVFKVSKPGDQNSSNNNQSNINTGTNTDSQQKSLSTSVYTVKSGDTLSHIAGAYGVSVSNLKKWNNLRSDLIHIGQKLSIGEAKKNGSASKPEVKEKEKPSNIDYNVSALTDIAAGLEGTGYKWAGSSPDSGFDCSGFIYYTYKQAGKDMKRLSSAGYYDRAYYVNNPQAGDLVFFEGTYKPGISHMGIYLGNNQFIHAGSKGVQVVSLNNSYWKSHFSSFKRFY